MEIYGTRARFAAAINSGRCVYSVGSAEHPSCSLIHLGSNIRDMLFICPSLMRCPRILTLCDLSLKKHMRHLRLHASTGSMNTPTYRRLHKCAHNMAASLSLLPPMREKYFNILYTFMSTHHKRGNVIKYYYANIIILSHPGNLIDALQLKRMKYVLLMKVKIINLLFVRICLMYRV